MKICSNKVLPIFYVLLLCGHIQFGQSKVNTINLTKGEVFDVLFISQNSSVEESLKSYFKKAFPLAKKLSYQPISGFKILKNTQGNISPQSLIFGKWKNIELREEFLKEVVKKIPDFHEQRRLIWSFFGLRYYEIEKSISFKINSDNYHVVNSFWLRSDKKGSTYYKRWKELLKNMGGEITIELINGKSPFGYMYDPNFLILTWWKNENDFKNFQSKVQSLDLDNIKHINEFILK